MVRELEVNCGCCSRVGLRKRVWSLLHQVVADGLEIFVGEWFAYDPIDLALSLIDALSGESKSRKEW